MNKVTPVEIASFISLYTEENKTLADIRRLTGWSERTISKYLKSNDIKVKLVNGNQQYTLNKHVFDRIDNEQSAYWLGFLMADGCVRSYKRKNGKLRSVTTIMLHRQDINHLHKFNHFISGKYPIKDYKTTSGPSIEVANKQICDALIEKGCTPAKSHTLDFPTYLPDHLISAFLRGYFDGDGSINIPKSKITKIGMKSEISYTTVTICSASELFITSLYHILTQKYGFDISVECVKKQNGKYKTKRMIPGKDDIKGHNWYNIRLKAKSKIPFLDIIYKDASIYLDRKYERYLSIKKSL